MKTTQNIGKLSGKLLVFGGVYSNFHALQTLKKIADAEGFLPNNIICTGDIVAYCAMPQECLELIQNWGIHNILGNVEIQLRDEEDDCGCNFNDGSRCDIFSRQWFPFAQKSVNAAAIDWLKTLPDHLVFEYADKKCAVVHGTFFETSGYIFHSSPWLDKQQNFDAAAADVILAGHCGLPFHDIQKDKYWLNPGVIGMPANDGTPRVWYMTLDDADGFSFVHHAFDYDCSTANQRMTENSLPLQYAQTLLTGLWDNCEILPKAETEAQGKKLIF